MPRKSALLRSLLTIFLVVITLIWLKTFHSETISERQLNWNAADVDIIPVKDIAPGDQRTAELKITNSSELSVPYRLEFFKRGDLWDCDSDGDNLYYRVGWKAGSDHVLVPGEDEIAFILIILPLPAGIECQGASGQLMLKPIVLSGGDVELSSRWSVNPLVGVDAR